ncbi:MAG: DoxX family protein [Myxococcota bacterium]
MTTTTAETPAPGKALHIGLWVAQVLLALAFGAAGAMKAFTPAAELATKMAWVNHVPAGLIPFIGLSEVAGALGLILPALTRIKPVLTPVAAALLVVVMVLAGALHVSIGEPPIPNVILGALAGFVAWGRFKRAPIAPRS